MRADPLNVILEEKISLDKKFYLISGNEVTLIEKILNLLIKKLKKASPITLENIQNIKAYDSQVNLFSDKKIYVLRDSKGLEKQVIEKMEQGTDLFIFVFENSPKIKTLKSSFLKRNDSYVLDCYELDKGSRRKLLNNFINVNGINIDKEAYWFLLEKLDSKYIFFENDLNKIKDLNFKYITIDEVKKLITVETGKNEKLFFYLFKNNKDIVNSYKDKTLTISDANNFYYYCKFFLLLIISCKSEDDFKKNIPNYLFREKDFLIDVFKKYNDKKKKKLLKLIQNTERFLRTKNEVSILIVFRFLLSFKKLTIS